MNIIEIGDNKYMPFPENSLGFWMCRVNLEKYVVPKEVEHNGTKYRIISIMNYCFKTSSIKYLEFEEGSYVREIKDYAFCSSSLEKIIIPPSVKIIHRFSFNGANVYVDERNEFISRSGDNFLYQNHPFEALEIYSSRKHINIRETITRITFRFSSIRITSVHFPSSIIRICSNAFNDCNNLKRITFGEHSRLESIGKSAFGFCNIAVIQFPSSLKFIKSYAFYSANVQYVHFTTDSKLEYIDDRAFNNCHFKSLSFPSSLKKIGIETFSNCVSINKIIFPNDSQLEEVSSISFRYCTEIKSITCPENIKRILMNDNQIYNKLKDI